MTRLGRPYQGQALSLSYLSHSISFISLHLSLLPSLFVDTRWRWGSMTRPWLTISRPSWPGLLPGTHSLWLFTTVCPRSSYPFCIVTYYIIWVSTSWTYSIFSYICISHHALFFLPFYSSFYVFFLSLSVNTFRLATVFLFPPVRWYWALHTLPQIYTANYATFTIQIHAITE